ncbi:MAG: T9SS type A sorting domain-containing protein [Ignavibacteria bacterium]|nr:T9SS type A sorting domain-containing protein [Ignavibacteria bacterium]
MKNLILKLTAFVFFLFITLQANSQYFVNTYDFPPYGSRTDYGYSIERNFDGTVAGRWSIAGVSNSTPNAGSFDWMYLKLSNTGTISCSVLLGFTQADSCFSHIQLSSGSRNNVLAGFYRTPSGREKASFSIIDSSCGHILTKQISDTLRHDYRQVVKNTADAFTAAGCIQSHITSGIYQNHILASQHSSAGTLLWAYNYIPPFPWVDERAYSITYQPIDGSYAITGITNRFTGAGGIYQAFIMKISAAGAPLWFYGYAPMAGLHSEGKKIVALPDGGFAVTGNSTAFDPAGDVYMLRVGPTGLVIWQNTYGSIGATERSESLIFQSTDATLVFTGSLKAAVTEDVILSKVTFATGLPVWIKRFPNSTGADNGYDLKEAGSPAGYTVTGKFFNSSSAGEDVLFIKTNSVGNVSAVCQDSLNYQVRPGQWSGNCQRSTVPLTEVTVTPVVTNPIPALRSVCGSLTGVNGNTEIASEYKLKQNYPNPFNPTTKIEFSIPENGNVSVKVYDLSGKLVKTLVNSFVMSGNHSVDFNGDGLSSGIYLYELKTEGFTETKKMMLIK